MFSLWIDHFLDSCAARGTVAELQTLLIGSLYLALEESFSRFVSIWLRKGNRDADVSNSALEMCNSAWSCLSDLSSRHVRTDDQDEMYTRLSTLHCATVALTQYLRTWQAVLLATHNPKQSVNRHPAGNNSGQNAAQEQGRDSCSCGADITSAFHSELSPSSPDPRIPNPNQPSDTLTQDRTHSLMYNLNLLTWEVCDGLYSETYYVLTRTEMASIRSEVDMRCNIVVDVNSRNWIYRTEWANAMRRGEADRLIIALSYYGFRILLIAPCRHYCAPWNTELELSKACIHMTSSFDYACRIIDLASEISSLSDLMSLPCWWSVVPHILFAAKLVIDGDTVLFAGYHLPPDRLYRLMGLARKWFAILNPALAEAGIFEEEFCEGVSRPARSSKSATEVLPDVLSSASLEMAGTQSWESPSLPLADAPVSAVSCAIPSQRRKPPLSLSASIRKFQEHLEISQDTYKSLMVSSLSTSLHCY